MGIEARYDSRIRYLTRRATQWSGAEAWEECVDSSQREPDRPPSSHLVNRLLFQLHRHFKEIMASRRRTALKDSPVEVAATVRAARSGENVVLLFQKKEEGGARGGSVA